VAIFRSARRRPISTSSSPTPPLDRAQPDLVIYLAGADPFVDDRFGRLALSKAGLATRDRLVISTLCDAGIPVAIAMAGGYAGNIDDVVDIHFATVAIALELFAAAQPMTPGKASSRPILPRAQHAAC